jgi:hypothetical protein
MVPGPDGSLFVSIPRARGAVLARLDAAGRTMPGWPISVPKSTRCWFLAPAADGSARLLCDGTDLHSDGSGPSDMRAFAFDGDGRLMAGWPARIPEGFVARVVGTDLLVLREQERKDVPAGNPDAPKSDVWLTRFGADGTVANAIHTLLTASDCGVAWSIGPTGTAYGIVETAVSPDDCDAYPRSPGPSRIRVLGVGGAEPGEVASVAGLASSSAFAPDGRLVLAVATPDRPRTWLVAMDPGTFKVVARSPRLAAETVSTGACVDCCSWGPPTPIVAGDGTVYLEVFGTFHAFDAQLRARAGWPFEAPGAQTAGWSSPDDDGLNCWGPVEPATATDGRLYLPLAAASGSAGGRLLAVGPDGKRLPGWPVKLARGGSTFQDVAVGADGTVYSLVLEPESRTTASATILAIDPDGKTRYHRTVVEP